MKIKKILKEIFINNFKLKKNKSASQKALLSFIVHPYLKKNKKHPNALELFTIVKVLSELDFRITIVDYRRKKISGNYDLVIGFGDCFEYAINNNIGKTYVNYSTGSPSIYQNKKSIEAMGRFMSNHPEQQPQSPCQYLRLTENIWPNQLISSDAIITIGNNYIKSLFSRFHGSVYTIPAICFDIEVDITEDMEIERNSIIWFGGKGIIHKGLDLCIDAVKNSKYKLYIAGPIDNEISIFEDIISMYPDNFKYIGFLDINSDKFIEYAKKIPYVILPSCSEGIATSVITLANNFGTIPIVSKECGIDYVRNVVRIESLTIESIKKSLCILDLSDNQEIIKNRIAIKKYFKEKYSITAFYSQFKKHLAKILQEEK